MKIASGLIFVTATLVLLVGCGSSSSAAPTYTTYTDSRYHFSFKYPSTWSPQAGKQGTADGVSSYLVDFTVPNGQFHVAVNGDRKSYSSIPNNDVKVIGSSTFTYYRITVSRLPALMIAQKSAAAGVDHEYAFINSPRLGYDVEIASGNGLSKSQQTQFAKVLQTFHIARGQ